MCKRHSTYLHDLLVNITNANSTVTEVVKFNQVAVGHRFVRVSDKEVIDGKHLDWFTNLTVNSCQITESINCSDSFATFPIEFFV